MRNLFLPVFLLVPGVVFAEIRELRQSIFGMD